MTEGRKSSGPWGDSTVLRTMVRGGFSALKPGLGQDNPQIGQDNPRMGQFPFSIGLDSFSDGSAHSQEIEYERF